MNTGRLAGKTAVVTGSTSGIGEAIALLFAKEGAAVVVSGRRSEKGEAVCKNIIEAGGRAIFVKTDVTIDADFDNLFQTALAQFGQIDILVNNAGTFMPKTFSETTPDDWDFLIRLDGRSNFMSMKKILPIMEKQGSGVIVNVTSLSATMPSVETALYSFMKAGLTMMSRCIAIEYAKKGIRINCLLPGATLTEMTAGRPNNAELEKMIPMGRFSTADEQAYAALYLASDESKYATGATLMVDGGWYPCW